MRLRHKVHSFMLFAVAALALCSAETVFAQTTLITYQGKLEFDGVPAAGNYDFRFNLFDAVSGGTLVGDTDDQLNVTVTNGAYTVIIDFGAMPFINSNADRFLEVSVRATGTSTFTPLPRQQITTTPYSIRANTAHSLDATCIGCVKSSQILSVQGAQVTGSVAGSQIFGTIPVTSVPAGSNNYIQNTISPQADVNFNISGSGFAGGMLSANVVNTSTQYNIGFGRVLGYTASNLYVGLNAGNATATGFYNISVGDGAGSDVTTGSGNNFFGLAAGKNNTTGSYNSFFGASAGLKNMTGNHNSFFGSNAGSKNTSSGNSFFGFNAGLSNTTASQNSFFGISAGESNTTGANNSFFGSNVGVSNTTGRRNSFFGDSAGAANTSAGDNSFFGYLAGNFNTGDSNSFFGSQAGESNTAAGLNSFFGSQAGQSNTGFFNSFFGARAGQSNTTGKNNSLFGTQAGFTNTTGHDNSFFGHIAGISNTTGQLNAFVGAGAGSGNTSGIQNSFFGSSAGRNNTTGSHNTFVGHTADFDTSNPTGNDNTLLGYNTSVSSGVSNSTAIGSGAQATASNTVVLGTKLETVIVRGKFQVDLLGTAGNQQLCLNSSNRIASCSSSLRYKTDLLPFSGGLSLINRLQPISFNWKDGGMRDLGFGAEDVHKIEPLLVTYDAQGLVEGVKYDRISAVLVNALKEQQQQIAAQQTQIEELTAIKVDNAELRARLAGILARLEQIEKAVLVDTQCR